MKVCSRCGAENNTKNSWCNPCRAEGMRRFRATPAGKESTKRMEANRVVSEARLLSTKRSAKAWAKTEKGRISLKTANAKYKTKHKNKLLAKERERRALDPMFKAAANLRRRTREVFSRKGFTSKSRLSVALGCDFEFFKAYIERQFVGGMSWNNFGEWQLDHIVPLSSAKTEHDLHRLSHYSNIQPMWGLYNKLKQDMLPDRWLEFKKVNDIDVSVKPIE